MAKIKTKKGKQSLLDKISSERKIDNLFILINCLGISISHLQYVLVKKLIDSVGYDKAIEIYQELVDGMKVSKKNSTKVREK